MRRRGLSQLGYTMVEVMMALAVLTVGATGIVAMQKATLLGNTRARNLATANAIAATWVDRLKVDALSWRPRAGNTSTIQRTTWLRHVGDDFPLKSGIEGTWFRPAVDPATGYSPMADVRGVDIADANQGANAAYCTHLRVTQILPNLVRAEVRVFWLRNHNAVGSTHAGTVNGMPLCSDDPGYIAKVGESTNRYHFVYMTAGLVQNGAP